MSSMEGCCKFIEKLNGELYGFIHSAGVLQDSMLMNLTGEKFETVFQSLGNRLTVPNFWWQSDLFKMFPSI